MNNMIIDRSVENTDKDSVRFVTDPHNTSNTGEWLMQTFRDIDSRYQTAQDARLMIDQHYRAIVPEYDHVELKQHDEILDVSVFVRGVLNYDLFDKLNAVRVKLEDSLKDFYLDIQYKRV